MRKQIDNMSNTYLLILSLILILMLVLGVRFINIYYASDLENSMLSHLMKLDSLYENYVEAGKSLGVFNDSYIDSELYERASGIIELIKEDDHFGDIFENNKNYFKATDTSFLQVLETNDIDSFVSTKYSIQIDEDSKGQGRIYFTTTIDGAPWRMLIEQIQNADKAILVGQKVS